MSLPPEATMEAFSPIPGPLPPHVLPPAPTPPVPVAASTSPPPPPPPPPQIHHHDKHLDAPTPIASTPEPTKPKKEAFPTNTKGLHTVFIHKLYNMLEDDELKHLIWWSPSNDSFVITPGEEFSRALAQYFKHTNVASFVRQLNMYGFHKVSDINNAGETSNNNSNNTSEVPTWEFRHSSGNFRKGDIDSLKQIKRRSSKHASGKLSNANGGAVSSHVDSSLLSDTEISSERSNSVSEFPPDPSSIDPMLNVRLAELGHNLAALRHEHARLQLRYDTAISDMKKTNLDMVYLLDIIQKLIHSNPLEATPTPTAPAPRDLLISPKPHLVEEVASPGSAVKAQNPLPSYSLQDVETDIARFRANIIQRAASKELDQFGAPFNASYQIDQRLNQFPPQYQQQHPLPATNPSPPESMANEPQRYPNTYPYPYPPQYQMFPHGQFHQQGQDPNVVHDPFRSDRKSSRSSYRSRNPSILCDPLQPSTATTSTLSPSSGNIQRSGSFTGGQYDSNGSYFPDYRSYQGQQRTHTPEPQHFGYKMSPVGPTARDQRAGSFPGLPPNVQSSLRGENLMRKRHNSNEGVEYRGMDNPPRSVPDEPFNKPQFPRKSLSATNISDARSPMDVVSKGPPNSGVYALLNPAERRDSAIALPAQKKTRNI